MPPVPAPAAARAVAAAHIPNTFRRLVAHVPAPSFREGALLDTVTFAPPPPGAVAVRVAHAGVNAGCETFRVRAHPGTPFAAAAPGTLVPLGAEGAGIVVAVGASVSSLAVGDAVVVSGASAFAEYVTTTPAACLKVASPSPAVTAAVLSGTTAAVALDGPGGGVGKGDTVLVTAAAGGTGHFAVQLAAAAGGRVVAVVGTPAKAAAVTRLLEQWPDESHSVIDRSSVSDLPAAIAAAVGPAGATLAYEGVGGALRASCLDALAPGGKLLCVGYMGAYPHTPHSPSTPAAPGLPPDDQLFWARGLVHLHDGRIVVGMCGAVPPAPRSHARANACFPTCRPAD